MEDLTKVCSKCGKELEISSFSKSKSGKYGVTSVCKLCYSEYFKQYYEKNKEKRRAYKRKYYKENKVKVSNGVKASKEKILNITQSITKDIMLRIRMLFWNIIGSIG